MHLTKGAEKAAAAPIIDGAIYLTETTVNSEPAESREVQRRSVSDNPWLEKKNKKADGSFSSTRYRYT
jgi:hypothetical protein